MSTDSKKKDVTDEDVENQIRNIFNQNKIDDLKKFLNKRACLNRTNHVLIYLFHIIQSAGVLTTTIAAGYNMKELVWIGVGMNILASLINVFEKTNDSMSKRILKDIQSIKTGTYVDEGSIIDIDVKNHDSKSPQNKSEGNTPANQSTTESEAGDIDIPTVNKSTALKKLVKGPLISDTTVQQFDNTPKIGPK
jgi:hypothetical protein